MSHCKYMEVRGELSGASFFFDIFSEPHLNLLWFYLLDQGKLKGVGYFSSPYRFLGSTHVNKFGSKYLYPLNRSLVP